MAPSHLSHQQPPDSKIEVEGNLLSNLDLTTYKIRFLMTSPTFPEKGLKITKEYLETENYYIIAETGKSNGFYIKDLGFSNTIAYKRAIKPLGITGQINIIEPYSMSLYERLVIAASKLNIYNHTNARYIIQINFQGYKPDGEQTVIEYEWFVPVIITKMQSTTTEQGSDYTIAFVGLDYESNLDIAKLAKEPLVIYAKTFEEFLNQLQEVLDAYQEDLVELGSQAHADTYEFKIDPSWTSDEFAGTDIGKYRIGATSSMDHGTNRQIDLSPSMGADYGGGGRIKLALAKGGDVNAFIGNVFMQTVEMQDRVTNDWENEYSKWLLTLESSNTVLKFDGIRNTYQKIYTTTLKQHFVPHEIKNGVEFKNAREDIDNVTARKLNILQAHNLLKKSYHWIYTGLNTEVLNFSFAFDNLYFVATNVYRGSKKGERRPAASSGGKFEDVDTDITDPIETMATEEFDADFNFRPAPPKRIITEARHEYIEEFILDGIIPDKQINFPFSNPVFSPDVTAHDLMSGAGAGGTTHTKDSNHITYNLITGDMMEISLQIKGDPFWLGRTASTSPSGSFSDYSKGSNYFYIEFRIPQGVEEDSGLMPMKTANTISGLYFVTRCESNFTDGQFVQNLTGYLDTTFGLTQVRQKLGSVGDLPI